ncbi:hypothetical protein HMI55_000232 [Coelomomyces lativittatus]|nr:hypothetical protein HMI55_000232 [Coelomomyces lativittatus]
MIFATVLAFFLGLISVSVSAPLDQCNLPPPVTTLPSCTSSNWGQQKCYSNSTFVVCNYNYWTVPMMCPSTLKCKPHPANPDFNIMCDY